MNEPIKKENPATESSLSQNIPFLDDLLKAQKAIETVDKDGKNPFFKSDYTTLNATINACKNALNNNNFVVIQPIESDENGVYVCTTLIHTSGKRLTSRMRIVALKEHDPQAQGSAITYARRYSLKTMLCMSDKDDDAESAVKHNQPEPVLVPTQQPVQKTKLCNIHSMEMTRRFSQQKNIWYYAHLFDNKMCFGNDSSGNK